MRKWVIALAQLNVRVGDVRGNVVHILDCARQARRRGVDVLITPELAVSGYPPEDLVLKKHFVRDCESALDWLAAELPDGLTLLVGVPLLGCGRPVNAAVEITRTGRGQTYRKRHLPNYGVFDEKRVFEEGHEPCILDLSGLRVGIHICEDSWYPDGASFFDLNGKIDLLVNLSASPFHSGKQADRKRIVGSAATRLNVPVAYCNLIGGQDELVFDGRSLVCGGEGVCRAFGAAFQEDLLLFSLKEIPGAGIHLEAEQNEFVPELERCAEVYAALRLGLRDYVEKNGFSKVLIAISGGVDSALVAALAVDALGADRVVGVTMPSRYSSEGTLSDSHRLASNLGFVVHEKPIESLVKAYRAELEPMWPGRAEDVTEENLQARIRGTIIMALSNKFSWLVLATGNKSEMATGYCTLYGDMVGGFALIKDVPKTMVFDLCRWRNRDEEWIPESILVRPPSAELRENQKDSDSLPPYELLDRILSAYVEEDQGVDEMIALGLDAEVVKRVVRLVDLNEYKRRQAPPGVKITPKAFGRDRRVPITNNYRVR